MRRTTRGQLVAAVAMAVGACACGPSLDTLVREQRYPEAVCKLERSDIESARSAAPRLASLGQPRWRVRRILPGDLRGLDPAVAAPLFDAYALLDVETQADPVAGVQTLFLSVEGADRAISTIPAMGTLGVAFITGEATPKAHDEKVTRLTPDAPQAVGLAMATAGISLLFKPVTETRTETVYPTDDEIDRAAPRAAAVARALRASFPSGTWVAVPRRGGASVARIRATMELRSHTPECGDYVDVRFAPVEVTLVEGQPWPAGPDFQPFDPHAWVELRTPYDVIDSQAGQAQ